MELEGRAVQLIGPRPGHRVDDASRRTPELGRVGVGEDLELEDRLDPQQYAARRPGGLVVDVVDVGPVEEEVVLLGAGAIDGNLRRPAADHVVARGQGGAHSRLEQRELLEGASIERQVPDLMLPDQPAQRPRGEVDPGDVGLDDDLLGPLAELESRVQHRALPDSQANAAPGQGLEPRHGEVDLVFARREQRDQEVAGPVRRPLLDGAGAQVPDDHLDAGQHVPACILHGSLDAPADVLGPGRPRPAEQCGQEHHDTRFSEHRAPPS